MEMEMVRNLMDATTYLRKCAFACGMDIPTEFSGILARSAARLDPETPYWPSSPSADYEDLNDSFQSGDAHDWSVWHGNANFNDFEKHHWAICLRIRFQSFPEMKTIKSFTEPQEPNQHFNAGHAGASEEQ